MFTERDCDLHPVAHQIPNHLPESLVFHVNYLGGDMPVFQINFSRPAGQIIASYYNFLRLGYEGYRKIHQASYDIGRYLAAEIATHQYRTLLGRTPTDEELAEARDAGAQCALGSCGAEEFARPLCFALLSSAERLFY